jgi:F-type H+-transporting ATPase subunit gamma
MAGLKQIKRRLVSVRNTRQITRAMKLVSAAKLNRAQDSTVRSRQYAAALNKMLSDLLGACAGHEIAHPLMQVKASVKRIRIVVVGGSRGLCGGYNTNINRQVDALIKRLMLEQPNAKIETILLGRKPAEYFRRVGLTYSKSYEQLPEDPNKWPIAELCAGLERGYAAEENAASNSADRTSEKNGENTESFQEAYLVYTKFNSVMTQKATVEKILPFEIPLTSAESSSTGLTIFEPSAETIFSSLIPRLLRVKIQQACLNSVTSEYASRMTAMDSATKNAGEIIDGLKLTYNRLRQSGITKELLDIVGGAEALNE